MRWLAAWSGSCSYGRPMRVDRRSDLAIYQIYQSSPIIAARSQEFAVTRHCPLFLSGLAVLLPAALAVAASTSSASAQGRLDARYEAKLAGIPIGKGSWIIDIADDQYSATANGLTAGLLRTFAGGQGSGGARGRVTNGQLVPNSYSATITVDKKSETVRIGLAGGNVKESSIDPEPPENPERLPVTDAHRKGAIDPMTASMIRVSGNGELVSAESCQSAQSIFDGRMRYDLRFAYKRIEQVKSSGYQGPVVVCSVFFTPIAGYIPDRAAIKYLAAQRNMEVWFAPIAGTRMLAMYKVSVPTPLGTGTVEATQFISTAQPRAAVAKTN
jgi:hypothetical protein